MLTNCERGDGRLFGTEPLLQPLCTLVFVKCVWILVAFAIF